MARPRKSAAGERSTRSTSRKSKAAAVEIVEEESGMSMPEAVIIVTTLVLLAAFVMLDKARGSYGEGMFFKDSATTSSSN
jgi:hypothetical protein